MKVGGFEFRGGVAICGSVASAESVALRRDRISHAWRQHGRLFLSFGEHSSKIDMRCTDAEFDAFLNWLGGLPPVPHHLPQPDAHDGGEGIGCEP